MKLFLYLVGSQGRGIYSINDDIRYNDKASGYVHYGGTQPKKTPSLTM